MLGPYVFGGLLVFYTTICISLGIGSLLRGYYAWGHLLMGGILLVCTVLYYWWFIRWHRGRGDGN